MESKLASSLWSSGIVGAIRRSFEPSNVLRGRSGSRSFGTFVDRGRSASRRRSPSRSRSRSRSRSTRRSNRSRSYGRPRRSVSRQSRSTVRSRSRGRRVPSRSRYIFRNGPSATFIRRHGGHVSLRRSVSRNANLGHKKNWLLPSGIRNQFWGRRRDTVAITAANGRLDVSAKLTKTDYVGDVSLTAYAGKRPRVISWNISFDRQGRSNRVDGRVYVLLTPASDFQSGFTAKDAGDLAAASTGQTLVYNLAQLPSSITIGVPTDLGQSWAGNDERLYLCVRIDINGRDASQTDSSFVFEMHPFITLSYDAS